MVAVVTPAGHVHVPDAGKLTVVCAQPTAPLKTSINEIIAPLRHLKNAGTKLFAVRHAARLRQKPLDVEVTRPVSTFELGKAMAPREYGCPLQIE
jgi:hypothetical protein